MRIPRRIALTAKITLVCLLAAGALAQAAGFRAQQEEARATAAKATAFRVRGNLKGLYPGKKMSLRARVTNTGRSPITLTRLTVKVRSTTIGCPASALKIKPFSKHTRIPGHASVKLSLPARMKASAPDACQGARFQLTYSGTGKGA